jgi:quercetin dioxygenase-like cupin family protein
MPVQDKKRVIEGGIRHVTMESLEWKDNDVRGTILSRGLVYEGAHGVESAFFRMAAGQRIERHVHELWVQVMVVRGGIHVDQEGAAPFDALAGTLYFLEPGFSHVETALEDTLVLVTEGDNRVFD